MYSCLGACKLGSFTSWSFAGTDVETAGYMSNVSWEPQARLHADLLTRDTLQLILREDDTSIIVESSIYCVETAWLALSAVTRGMQSGSHSISHPKWQKTILQLSRSAQRAILDVGRIICKSVGGRWLLIKISGRNSIPYKGQCEYRARP